MSFENVALKNQHAIFRWPDQRATVFDQVGGGPWGGVLSLPKLERKVLLEAALKWPYVLIRTWFIFGLWYEYQMPIAHNNNKMSSCNVCSVFAVT